MNLAACRWDPVLCDLFGVPVETLPEIVPTTGTFGAVEVAGRAVPLRASVVDQQAALYGHGCRGPGSLKITFGTGAFALAVTGDAPLSPGHGLLPTVAWAFDGEPAVYALDGGVYNAGSAVDWAQRVGLVADHAELDPAGPMALDKGIAFVPALSGLACPHWDRDAAGLFIGLSLETSRADMARAVIEGVALRAAEVVQAMALEIPIGDTVSIDGGLAAGRHLRQVLADALGRTIVYRDQPELTALGCAALASPTRAPPPHPATTPGSVTYPVRRDGPALLDRFSGAIDRSRAWRA
jgi:glycerol kinase